MNIRYARHVVFSTNDSAVPVTITWPDPLTDAELSEVKEFVALWLKGVERRSSAQETPVDDCMAKVRQHFDERQAAETPVTPELTREQLGWCKHDDGDCHEDDPCKTCPRYPTANGKGAHDGN